MRWTQFDNPLLAQSVGFGTALVIMAVLIFAFNVHVLWAALIAVAACFVLCYALWPSSESAGEQ